MDRYSTDLEESQFEPGSNGRVLRNKLGIRRLREMQKMESQSLLVLTEALLNEVTETQRFTPADIVDMHRRWLGEIYSWAGEYRRVNMTKGGFPFAAADQVPRLMVEFERTELATHTPCSGMREERLVEALAVVHAELILIHPFREGNGRLARLLNALMAAQAVT